LGARNLTTCDREIGGKFFGPTLFLETNLATENL